MSDARRFARWSVGVAVAAVLLGGPARADDPPAQPPAAEPPAEPPIDEHGLAPGTEAPAIEVAGWANVPEGKEPTAETWKGKPLCIEFWSTTCGPCVRTMAKVQEIHERFGPRGLVVLAIAPDAAHAQETFAKEKGLTFPLGIDVSGALKSAFRVEGVPTTYLVGKDGKIAARTSPMHADEALDALLGYRKGPTGPLDDYLDAVGAKDAGSARFHLERQISRMAAAVDLVAWAKAEGGAPPATPGSKPDPAKALADLAKARTAGDAAKQKALLDALAGQGPTSFDLSAWARDACARDFPVTAKELKELVERGRFDAAVDAIVDRRPPSAALDGIAKAAALQDHCAKNASKQRVRARKALMLLLWPLADRFFKDEAVNKKFWNDLGSSGWVEDVKTRKPIAMDVEGTMVFKGTGPGLVDRWLARAFVMEALAAGKKPDLARQKAEVAKARAAIEKELEATYGG